MKIRNNDLRHKSIDIDISDCVTVSLHKEEYDELVRLLLPEMEQEVKAAASSIKTADKKREECRKFSKEIREVFYDDHYPYCMQKSINRIDTESLSAILDKYDDMLGFN